MASFRKRLIARMGHVPSTSDANLHPFFCPLWDKFVEDILLQILVLRIETSQVVRDQYSIMVLNDGRLDARRAEHKVFIYLV
jgi:hypothetical protein